MITMLEVLAGMAIGAGTLLYLVGCCKQSLRHVALALCGWALAAMILCAAQVMSHCFPD